MGFLFKTGELLNDRYKVERILGCGGSGAVYLCQDILIGSSKVAVKAFHPSVMDDPASRTRIQRELLASASIEHHNITRTHEAFWQGDVFAFAMDYAPGDTLHGMLLKRGPIATSEATWILCQICNGLQAIHARGLVHRDITSNNIIVSPQGNIKITDLGLVRDPINFQQGHAESVAKVSPFARTRATLDGQMAGTPLYLSPEYVRDGRCDALTDIYGVGIIGYELLTGTAPFHDLELAELFHAKTSRSAPSLETLCPTLPTLLVRAIDRAVALNPEDRFQSVKEMHDALSPLLESALPSGVYRRRIASAPEKPTPTHPVTINHTNVVAISLTAVLLALAAITTLKSGPLGVLRDAALSVRYRIERLFAKKPEPNRKYDHYSDYTK